MRPFYTVGELARVFADGRPDRYQYEWRKKTVLYLRHKGIELGSIGRSRIVYLSDIQKKWPELHTSMVAADAADRCRE